MRANCEWTGNELLFFATVKVSVAGFATRHTPYAVSAKLVRQLDSTQFIGRELTASLTVFCGIAAVRFAI